MNWVNDFYTLVDTVRTEMVGFVSDWTINEVVDSDDGDVLSEVDELTGFPLVVLNFEGNDSYPNSMSQYIESSHEVSVSINYKKDATDNGTIHEAKEKIRPIVDKFFSVVSTIGYSLASKRIRYDYGMIGSIKVARVSFTITK
jgi:hypothetical protein